MTDQNETTSPSAEHEKMLDQATQVLRDAKVDNIVALAVDNGERTTLLTNAGSQGIMHLIDVLSVQIGRMIIADKEPEREPAYTEAYLVGAMAIARSNMDKVQAMKKAQEEGAANDNGGKHYSDTIEDGAAGSDGAGNVH